LLRPEEGRSGNPEREQECQDCVFQKLSHSVFPFFSLGAFGGGLLMERIPATVSGVSGPFDHKVAASGKT
jgi:hypothetical protein